MKELPFTTQQTEEVSLFKELKLQIPEDIVNSLLNEPLQPYTVQKMDLEQQVLLLNIVDTMAIVKMKMVSRN